ncbi:MAG: alanine racemase C-terminal domain-containing protein, partial [Gemmatimonadota bacterium]|nr:alanine racemase C-terminal domain-containing protein [Gemmatimonadota bacterium]
LVEVGTIVTVIDDDEDEYEFFVAPSENKVPGILLASPESPLGAALLGGRRVPVVGTVTMDLTMVDVTDVPCALGDVATLIGADGDEVITAEDVGRACGLSPYEILTGLRARAPRSYA